MDGFAELALRAVLIGAGATATLDLWAAFQKMAFKVQGLSYRMVGRWIGHLPRGRFAHDNIAEAAPVAGERIIGWSAHYLIGIVFGAALLLICGVEWARQPTLPPALIAGVVTVAAPFFILQPGMGAGVAASKTPKPNTARLRSLISHTVFGLGLYVSAAATTLALPN